MADELDHIEVSIPLPPPQPPSLPEVLFNERRNLMKSPASLIGKGNQSYVKKSALDVCRSFLCSRYSEAVADSRKLSWFYYNNDVEALLQDGPTCGLIALKLAADILKISDSSVSLPKVEESEIAELLQLAKDNGFTYRGEMFSASDVATLAKMFYDMDYQVVSSGLEDYVNLVHHIVQGYPVLVPYDADRNNEPCLKRGHNAHWAVITGCLLGLEDTNIRTLIDPGSEEFPVYPLKVEKSAPLTFASKDLFLIARHGKSRHYGMWPWIDLFNSNNNLFECDPVELEDIEKQDGRRCLFTEGVNEGLCSKVLYFSLS